MIGRFLLLAIMLTRLCRMPAALMPSGIETVKGTSQAGRGWRMTAGGLFCVHLCAQSLLMTALQLAAPTAWSAVMVHWITNLTGGELMRFLAEAVWYPTVLLPS